MAARHDYVCPRCGVYFNLRVDPVTSNFECQCENTEPGVVRVSYVMEEEKKAELFMNRKRRRATRRKRDGGI